LVVTDSTAEALAGVSHVVSVKTGSHPRAAVRIPVEMIRTFSRLIRCIAWRMV
jgi:hypothetical protein